jgi:putative hemolysin
MGLMIRYYSFIFTIIFTLPVFSYELFSREYFERKDTELLEYKKNSVLFVEYLGVDIDEKSAKNKNSMAQKIIRKDSNLNISYSTLAGQLNLSHPGSAYCIKMSGQNKIFYTETGEEIDICQFKDSSILRTWQLYYKHLKKEQVVK